MPIKVNNKSPKCSFTFKWETPSWLSFLPFVCPTPHVFRISKVGITYDDHVIPWDGFWGATYEDGVLWIKFKRIDHKSKNVFMSQWTRIEMPDTILGNRVLECIHSSQKRFHKPANLKGYYFMK